MGHDARATGCRSVASSRAPRTSASARSACRKEYGGFDLDPRPRCAPSRCIAEEVARGDSGLADKLVQNWKVAILLRESRAARPASATMVQAAARRSAVPAGPLPDRAARRLGPLAALQRARGGDAAPARCARRRPLGAERAQAVHLERLRREALRRLCQHRPHPRHARTARRASSCRATRPASTVTKCNETLGCRFMNNGELTLEDCRVPAANLLVRDKALGSAGPTSAPARSSRPPRTSASASPVSNAPPISSRPMSRAAASSSSIRPSRCALPTWPPASPRCAHWSTAPRAPSTNATRTPMCCATWPRSMPPKRS
jgi:hypothetical protein